MVIHTHIPKDRVSEHTPRRKVPIEKSRNEGEKPLEEEGKEECVDEDCAVLWRQVVHDDGASASKPSGGANEEDEDDHLA